MLYFLQISRVLEPAWYSLITVRISAGVNFLDHGRRVRTVGVGVSGAVICILLIFLEAAHDHYGDRYDADCQPYLFE